MFAATSLAGTAEEPPTDQYEQIDAFRVYKDPAQKQYFPEGKASFYTRYLAAMQEPSVLADLGLAETRVIRFTYLRSFHNPLAVRITESKGAVTARVVVLEMDEEYRPVKIVEDRNFKLDEQQRRVAQALAENRAFWQPITPIEETLFKAGTDGAQWIFEIHDSDGYRVVAVWSPDALGDVSDLKGVRDFQVYKKTGIKLLRMGGILPPEDECY